MFAYSLAWHPQEKPDKAEMTAAARSSLKAQGLEEPSTPEKAKGDAAMSEDDFEVIYGSGNVFRDFGYPDADIRQAKCILAAEIIKILDARQWTIRRAEEATGVNHADFARIRNVNLGRFTLDRLLAIIGKLGQEVELTVSVRPRQPQGMHPAPQR